MYRPAGRGQSPACSRAALLSLLGAAVLLLACSRPGGPQASPAEDKAPAIPRAAPASSTTGDPPRETTTEADTQSTTASTSASSSTTATTTTTATTATGDENAPPAPPEPFIDRLITYDDKRKALTIDYRRKHEGGDPHDVVIEPRLIVLHHTGGSSVDAAWRYFNRTKIEGGRKTLAKGGDVNVGAQFLVDRDGTILRLMPENWHARHCIGFNHIAIGVENVGDGKEHPLTKAQIEANAKLVRYLAAVYPITHVIGHNEANKMREHPYFHEEVAGYKTRKGDPGPAFMAAVRERVADLDLEGPPAATAPTAR